MTTTTIKKIRAVKPPYPFEAYSHIISQLSKEEGGYLASKKISIGTFLQGMILQEKLKME